MRTFNVKYILEEKYIIETKDTWRNFIWETVSQFSRVDQLREGSLAWRILKWRFVCRLYGNG